MTWDDGRLNRAIRDRVKHPLPDYSKPYVPPTPEEKIQMAEKTRLFRARIQALAPNDVLTVFAEAVAHGKERDNIDVGDKKLLAMAEELLNINTSNGRVQEIVVATQQDGVFFAWECQFGFAIHYMGRFLLEQPNDKHGVTMAERTVLYAACAANLFPEELFDLIERNKGGGA